MAVISVSKFSGVSPMTPPRYLGNEAAQTALNCPVWMGSLQSIRGISNTGLTPDPLTKNLAHKSIYRFGQDRTDEKEYWFHWADDVDVVQGFIAGDTTERTYFTGDGVPKVTNHLLSTTAVVLTGSIDPTASTAVVGVGTLFTSELSVGNTIRVSGLDRVVDSITDDTHLAVTVAFTDVANDTAPVKLDPASANYPIVSYELGVPAPTSIFTTSVPASPAANPNTVAETRVYTYTYVNSWGEESTPYAAADMSGSTEDVYPGQSVALTSIPTAPSGAFDIDKKRIYRSATGSTDTSFFFVAEIPVTDTSYTDSIAGDSLNEVLPSLTWVQPKPTLKGLIGLPNGIMVGFTGNDVYFSEPFRPFAWPIQYAQTVGWPVVGLGVIDTTVVVLTKGRPYFIQGSHPDSMVMIEADVNQACLSKRSIVSMGNYVFYASPDGLVGLSPGGSTVVTQSMFDKNTWQTLSPEGLLGCMYENKYIGFFDTDSGNGGFVYDMVAKTWNFHDIYATGAYNDLKNDALYVVKEADKTLYKWDEGDVLNYVWKSKKFTFPEPKSFSCYRVQAEAYPVTMKIYRFDIVTQSMVSVVNESVTSSGLRRIPAGMGTDWEFQIEGDKEVYNVQIAQSPMELNEQ